ncbi:hypothetical protein V5E97_25775 [Singulisphaera sp. Ch08]|uniref:Uncharacterized protein n=1 Tax=Singulisphaera sp. Ch08 TaxID=3120278 RepID=A0AAU7CAK0_9BACT
MLSAAGDYPAGMLSAAGDYPAGMLSAAGDYPAGVTQIAPPTFNAPPDGGHAASNRFTETPSSVNSNGYADDPPNNCASYGTRDCAW